MLKNLFIGLFFGSLLLAMPASAQTFCPQLVYGAVLTAAQWQNCFIVKQDALGYTPLNKGGDAMFGELTTVAPTAANAGFNLIPGIAPTSPVNGDLWTTSGGVFAHINGATLPLSSAFGVQADNVVWAGPASGAAAAPTFRLLGSTDIPTTLLTARTINLNAAAAPTPVTGTVLQLISADSSSGSVEDDSFAGSPIYIGRRADGTGAAPSAVQTNDVLAGFSARPYDGSAYASSSVANVQAVALENFTTAHHGTGVNINCTTIGTLTTGVCGQFNSTGFQGAVGATTPATGAFTTVNGNTITTGTGTVTLAASSTFQTTGAFTFNLTCGAACTPTFPSGAHTLAGLDVAQTWTAIQTFTNSDIALLGSSTGKTTFTSDNSTGTAYTLHFPAITSTVVTLDGVSQALGGGFHITSYSIGVESSGTYQINCGNGPQQYLTNGGAFTLSAPANDGNCVILITNNASAGTITPSGFTSAAFFGDTMVSTTAYKYILSIMTINGTSIGIAKGLQ
jgi:hypothetical protein